MNDMLVRLYDLLPINENESFKMQGIKVQRAMPQDKQKILKWVSDHFGEGWCGECDVAFANKPVSCYIAVKDNCKIIGFACYEATCKSYFGPTGVAEEFRGKGIGRMLLVESLFSLKELGYAYGIIGGVNGAEEFYQKSVDAWIIPKSNISIYRNAIR